MQNMGKANTGKVMFITLVSAVLLIVCDAINVNNAIDGIRIDDYNDWNLSVIRLGSDNQVCNAVPISDRFNCHPEQGENQNQCLTRGCCWIEEAESQSPSCFFPSSYDGYQIYSTHFYANEIIIQLIRHHPSGLPNDIENLTLNCTFLNENQLRITIRDSLHDRYEVFLPNNLKELRKPTAHSHLFKVVLVENHLQIVRTKTGKVIFDLNLSQMIYADQLIQVSVGLPSPYVYGIGDTKSPLLKSTDWTKYILFARDRPPIENMNLYSSHPFYLIMEDGPQEHTGNAHGVLLLNSNAMEVLLQPKPAITFRTIGGIVDFVVNLGPSPVEVISQHTATIGFTFMPPYWSLGFHLCKLGYNSVNYTREVLNRNRYFGIPIEVQWNDIDYMNKRNDFTINPDGFQDLPQFVDELHRQGMHYILITDPGISGGEPKGTYPALDDGIARDIFVKNSSGNNLYGKAWNPESTLYPDFTHPNVTDYYTEQLQRFHQTVPFDGIWLDMNEPTDFVNGSLQGCPDDSKLDNPPFIPGNIEPMCTQTICMSARQSAGSHYDMHNLYGTTHAIVTNAALTKVRSGKRPFIISRSTFPGQGHYAGTWDGDVYSTWDHMRWTIPSIINLNMYGISVSGADICGFNDNTTMELCARWTALGSFYPFSRNHNSDDTIEQDPYVLGSHVINSAVKNLRMRYYLLPYMYTLMFLSHTQGTTVARALFFEFPLDKTTYGIDSQFMLGSAILVVPVLEQGATEVVGYLPAGVWYEMQNGITHSDSKGRNVTFPTDLESINILLRGGNVIPAQETGKNIYITTTASRKDDFSILIALDENDNASGSLYWDDGDTPDTFENGVYNSIEFRVSDRELFMTCVHCGYDVEMPLASALFYGLKEAPRNVTIDGREANCKFEPVGKVLSCGGLQGNLKKSTMTWWYE